MPKTPIKPEPPVDATGNVDLEAAILQNPSDPQAYLVYADWLQGKGDPRGELISVQHARLTADTPQLRAREAELLAGHYDAFFGELAPLLQKSGGLSVTWRLGFLQRVRIGWDDYRSTIDVADTLRKVLALPIGRCVEELVIGLCDEPGDGDFQAAIDALIEAKAPQTLRSLFLGDFEYPDQSDISSTQVGDLSALYSVFPGLRALRLRGGSATLGKILLPELREFTFETGALSLDSVHAIGAAQWPRLETLSVWFGDENYGAEAGFDDLQPILDGRGLGSLKHLGLVNSSFLTGNIEALAKAKVLAQLQTLDLSKGVLGDEDAEAMVRSSTAFKHLRVDVTRNYFSERGLYLLRRAVKELVSTDQNQSGPGDGRYVAVGE